MRGEVAEEVPVALGLALLGAAEHGVELVDRLAWQQGAQEHHRVAHGLEVGLEVAAGEAEDLRHLLGLGDHGVDAQAAVVVHQRDHDRREPALAEHAADEVGALLAVEHGLEQLEVAHRHRAMDAEAAQQFVGHAPRAHARVLVGQVEGIAVEHAPQRALEVARDRIAVAAHRMGDAVGGLDVQRHELDRRVDAAGLEVAPREGIEEGLVELAVEQGADQFLVVAADRRPQRLVGDARPQAPGQVRVGLGHAHVVELDALDRVGARTAPVAALEAPPRALGDGAEARVVVGEAVADPGGAGTREHVVGEFVVGGGHGGSLASRPPCRSRFSCDQAYRAQSALLRSRLRRSALCAR